jgi:hypothetical protein
LCAGSVFEALRRADGWIRTRIGIQPKILDPDPDEINADPQPCLSSLFSDCAGSVFEALRRAGDLNLGEALTEADQTSLLEYMALRYSAIQSVRCGEEGQPQQQLQQQQQQQQPQFLELVHAHEAWGAKMRVDLIWRPLAARNTAAPLGARATNQRGRATPPPRPRVEEGDEGLVTIIQAASPSTSKEALFR